MIASNRRGVALFAALVLVTVVALLIGGALASSSLAERSGQISQSDAVLTASADYAINSVLMDARAKGLSDQVLGRGTSYDVAVPASAVIAGVMATRLPGGVVWLVADAALSGRDSGRRRLNVVARWRPVGPLPRAAIVARGAVRVGAGVSLSSDPAGDVDCAASSTADVITPLGVLVTSVDSVRSIADGVAVDSSVYYSSAFQRQLLDSMPGVIHVRGDTTIAGGTFDGILMVDGVLAIAGPLSASGLIIARGRVVATGGLSLVGALLAFATPPIGQYSIDLAGAAIRFSPCVIARAVRRAQTLRPVRERSWSELF